MPLRVEQTPDLPAGRARLSGPSAHGLDPASLEIAILRVDRGSPMHLDPTQSGPGVWTAAQRWIRPDMVSTAAGLGFELGPRVTVHLRPHTPYRVLMRDGAGGQGEERVTWAPIRLPSAAPEPDAPEAAFAEPAAPDPLAAFAELAAQAAPPLSADLRRAPPAPRRAVWPWAVAALVLGVAGVAGYEFAGPGGLRAALLGDAPGPAAAAPAPPPADPAPPPGRIPTTVAGAREYLNTTRPGVETALAEADRFEAAGTPQGHEGAFLILKYADRARSPAAALRLARIYDPDTFRPGVWPVPSASADDAVFYYVKAAEAGEVAAMLRAGELYRAGTASAPDAPERALYWLRKAAEAGSAKAKEMIP